LELFEPSYCNPELSNGDALVKVPERLLRVLLERAKHAVQLLGALPEGTIRGSEQTDAAC